MAQNDELEINISDLFFWLWKYKYLFLVVLIIGGIIGSGFASIKNILKDNVSTSEQIALIKDNLTPRESEEVESIVKKLELAKTMKDDLTAEMSLGNYRGDELEDAIMRVDYWNDQYNQQRTLALGLFNYQKDYYDLLTADPDKNPDYESIPKDAIIGSLSMFALLFLFLCFSYILSPTVKTSGELPVMFGVPLLMTIDETDMLSTDIIIQMKNATLNNLAILFDDKNEIEKEAANRLMENLKEHSNDISLCVIAPLSSSKELQRLSECDSVVTLVSIKKTSRSHLQELFACCKRYGCNILGFVTLDTELK